MNRAVTMEVSPKGRKRARRTHGVYLRAINQGFINGQARTRNPPEPPIARAGEPLTAASRRALLRRTAKVASKVAAQAEVPVGKQPGVRDLMYEQPMFDK